MTDDEMMKMESIITAIKEDTLYLRVSDVDLLRDNST